MRLPETEIEVGFFSQKDNGKSQIRDPLLRIQVVLNESSTLAKRRQEWPLGVNLSNLRYRGIPD